MWKNFGKVFILASLVILPNAFALDSQTISDLSKLNGDSVTNLLKTSGLGTDHRTYSSASPLGIAIGLEVGVEATVVSVPSDFTAALALATGQSTASLPSILPVPKLSIQKGLPFGVDLSFSYATSKMLLGQDDLFKMWGLGAKWAAIKGDGAKPAIAGRLVYSSSNLWFLNTHTFALDGVISKNLYLIEPYGGLGLKYWTGELSIPLALPAGLGLPSGVSGTATGLNPHFFAGLLFKMFLMRVGFEYDYNTAGISSYGGKVVLSF